MVVILLPSRSSGEHARTAFFLPALFRSAA
jgi:hypothetical protein